MTMARWVPLRDMVSVSRALDRFFDDPWSHRPRLGRWIEAQPLPLDVYEEGPDVVVKASLPGVRPEDVELNVSRDTLALKVESKAEEVKEESYYRRERRPGSLRRVVSLPVGLSAEKADARFEHGVLTVRIPKAEEARPRTIKIRTEE